MVCLFQDKTEELIGLLEKFSGVNDPYVSERIYAAAYCAVLRSSQFDGVGNLVGYIYTTFFGRGYINPHILTRDYARGIIEYALYIGLADDLKVKRFRPPYRSKPLPQKFPTTKEIDKNINQNKEKENIAEMNGALLLFCIR